MTNRNKSAEQWASELNFAAIERAHGLPTGVLTNLVRQESRGNADALGPVTKYGRAVGLCQILPSTAKELKCDPSNPASAVEGAATYLERLMDRYGGDPLKAIAAYNYGPGNMNRILKKYGDNWHEGLKAIGNKETYDYVNIVGKGIGKSFTQRQRDNEEIPQEEIEAEENRRKKVLKDFGVDPDSLGIGGKILTALFFQIMQPLLDALFSKMGFDMSDKEASKDSPAPQQTTRFPVSAANQNTISAPTIRAVAAAPSVNVPAKLTSERA